MTVLKSIAALLRKKKLRSGHKTAVLTGMTGKDALKMNSLEEKQ